MFIDHIDCNTLNNNINNLRILTNQQNVFNTDAKGYYWNKNNNKFHSQICLDYKLKHLGYYNTEAEASMAYKAAKLIYHVIN